jgi:polysaccharide chain length determinant protein (PEP-CTERM system associated)
MEEQIQLTLKDYIDIARRRWLYFLVPFTLIFAAAVVVSIMLPPVYESSGTILIESQQIPDELIRSTVTSYADERIQVIQQLVMTRDNLLRISDKFNLFADSRSSLTVSERVDLLRNRIQVSRVAGDMGGRRSRTTIAFTVGFEDRSPEIAYSVANELVTLFLEENVKSRTARASETTDFLGEQAEKLKKQLETIEAQIAAYKQENSEALPEHLDLHMRMLERTEAGIKEVEREIKATRDELRFLEVERGAIDSGLTPSGENSATPSSPAQALAQAQAELSRLQGIYADKHPAIRRQKALVAQFREALDNAAETDESAPETMVAAANLDLARINARLTSVQSRLESLEVQGRELEKRRTELEEIIIQTPQVQRALASLSRDYENTLAKYNEIQAKEMEAQVAESLEEGKKAERFSLIEPPVRPDKPIKPNRQKIAAFGFILAGAAAFGLVVLLELLNQRIRTADALGRVMGERPLVAIPYMVIDEEVKRRRRMLRNGLIVLVVLGLAAVAAVHFLYMPLDMVMIKIMTRLG